MDAKCFEIVSATPHFYGWVNEINDEAIEKLSLSAAGLLWYFTHNLLLKSVHNKHGQAATSTFLLFFHYQASCALNYFWKYRRPKRLASSRITPERLSLLVHYSPRLVVVRSLELNHLLKRFNFLLPLLRHSVLKSTRECVRALSLIFLAAEMRSMRSHSRTMLRHICFRYCRKLPVVVFSSSCAFHALLGCDFLCACASWNFGTQKSRF